MNISDISNENAVKSSSSTNFTGLKPASAAIQTVNNHFADKAVDTSFLSLASRSLANSFKLNVASASNTSSNESQTPLNSLQKIQTEKTETKSVAESIKEQQELSESEMKLMFEAGINKNDMLGAKTYESGASVILHKKIEENAQSGANEDVYYASIMQKDGSVSTQKVMENTIFSEQANGFVSATNNTETSSTSILGTNNDDFIVNLTASSISSKNGNDTILNLAKNTEVQKLSLNLSEGNNTVISGAKYQTDMYIVGGDGNNTIIGAKELTASFGNGNNIIQANSSNRLNLGDGNNNVSITEIADLDFGAGNNNIVAQKAASIVGGNGNNSLGIDELTENLQLGNGDNDVNVNKLYDAEYLEYYKSFLKDGSTAHMLFPPSKPDGADIKLGDGNNNLSVARTLEEDSELNGNIGRTSTISAGNGNNNISLSHVGEFMNFSVGGGNNNIELAYVNNDLRLGDGNNYLNIKKADNLEINAGDGHNIINVNSDVANLNYTGAGSSDINVNGSIFAGNISNNGLGHSSLNVYGNLMNSNIYSADILTANIGGNVVNSQIKAENNDSAFYVKGETVNSELSHQIVA